MARAMVGGEGDRFGDPIPVGRLMSIFQASSGSIAYAALQVMTFAMITRNGGVEHAAQFLLAQAVATPLALLAGHQLNEQLATEPIESSYSRRIYRLVAISTAVFAFGVGYWIVFSNGAMTVVGISVLLANLAQAHVTAFQGRMARRQRFLAASHLNTLLGLLSLLSIVIGYLIGGGLVVGSLGMALSWVLVGGSVSVHEVLASRLTRASGGRGITTTLAQDLSLGLSAMVLIGQSSAVRLGLDALGDSLALAQVGAAGFLVQAGSVLTAAAKTVVGPVLAEAKVAGELSAVVSRFRRSTLLAVIWGTPLAFAVGYVVAPPMLSVLFTADVAPDAITAGTMAAGAVFLYASMFSTTLAVALRRSYRIGMSSGGALAVSGLSMFPLIHAYGAVGGAIALSLGYIVRFLVIHQRA